MNSKILVQKCDRKQNICIVYKYFSTRNWVHKITLLSSGKEEMYFLEHWRI